MTAQEFLKRKGVSNFTRQLTEKESQELLAINSGAASNAAATAIWGGITGTLSNQTDLQTALNAKAPTASPTFTGTVTTPAVIVSSETADRLTILDATKNIKSADTATYPSLTEISYVKGVTSAIQTQINALPTASSTTTFTNKRITARTGTVASSATPTINTDNVDFFSITALAVDITSMTTNLSGTPTEGQTLWIAIIGTAARAITWGASFEASTIALPTTTVTTNRLDVAFIWNAVTSKWRCVGTC